MYLAKHSGCYSIRPETCILLLTKGKLWFAWFSLKYSCNNRFGKSNADCTDKAASAERKRPIDNSSRPLKKWHCIFRFITKNRILRTLEVVMLTSRKHNSIEGLRIMQSATNKFCLYLELCIASISFSTVFLSTGVYEETVAGFFFFLVLFFFFTLIPLLLMCSLENK